ncbi:MAG: transporter substrate-binding domain-containing protein [Clostridia bacterium]|nr:transporter substrate-binding domain-containing protein [Clostridia bacterium]
MKKKLLALAAMIVASIMLFSMVACNSGAKVKVLKDIELTSEEYAFAIQKGNTTLLNQVNDILGEMKEDGSLETLINSYFDSTATFTYTNKTSAPAKGDFVVATNAYFPPFEYYEGNKLTGIDIEIASIIATKLNKTLFVLDMDFDPIIASVEMGESDIGMAGMTVDESRLKRVDFAIGYYESAQVITVRADDTTFDSCKTAEDVEKILAEKDSSYLVGTQNGTTGYMYSAGDEDFGYDGFKNLTTKGYTTGALAVKDLSNGKINAVILDKQPSIMIAEGLNR